MQQKTETITENTKEVQDAVGKDLQVIGVLLAPIARRTWEMGQPSSCKEPLQETFWEAYNNSSHGSVVWKLKMKTRTDTFNESMNGAKSIIKCDKTMFPIMFFGD